MASTVRSRRLGAELRRLREAKKLKADAVAEEMGFSRPKLSRIESGEVRVSLNDVKALLQAYGVDDEAQVRYFLAASREARKAGWWHRYQDSLPREYAEYIELEAAASEIRNFEPIMIPGLLQTEAYTRAVILANPAILPPADIEALVAIRIERQKALVGERPVRLWTIVGESAIRQAVGGAAVLREQLRHLEECARQRRVVVQVLPHRVGAHAGLNGGFVVFGFPSEHEADIVCVENMTGTLYMDEPGECAAYGVAFDHLRATALSPDDSLTLIRHVAQELEDDETNGTRHSQRPVA
ncbi:helix-turn-helix domain-containing protein [Streptomyces sp. NPDC004749]